MATKLYKISGHAKQLVGKNKHELPPCSNSTYPSAGSTNPKVELRYMTIDIEHDWDSGSGMKKFKFSFTIDKNSKTNIDKKSFSVETLVTTTATPSTPSITATTTAQPESGYFIFRVLVTRQHESIYSLMSTGIH